MTEEEQQWVEKRVEEWDIHEMETYWDSSDECEVPCDVEERYCILIHQKPSLDFLYNSDCSRAVLSRNREWSQTNSNKKGLSHHIRMNIRCLQKHWRIVCPKLKVPTCTPMFPKGVHDLYL